MCLVKKKLSSYCSLCTNIYSLSSKYYQINFSSPGFTHSEEKHNHQWTFKKKWGWRQVWWMHNLKIKQEVDGCLSKGDFEEMSLSLHGSGFSSHFNESILSNCSLPWFIKKIRLVWPSLNNTGSHKSALQIESSCAKVPGLIHKGMDELNWTDRNTDELSIHKQIFFVSYILFVCLCIFSNLTCFYLYPIMLNEHI